MNGANRGGPGGGGILGLYGKSMGNRPVRYNRGLDKLGGSPLVMRVPRDVLSDEHNVLLAFPRLPVGAGATITFAVNAPRDCIIRDMAWQEVSLAAGAVGTADYILQSFTVEGNALSLSVGTFIGVFSPVARNRPTIDLPAAGGTPVSIAWPNLSAVNGVLAGALYID